MISGLFTTIDNALVQENRYNTIANNIANAGTSGFKKDLVSFTRVMRSHALEQQVHTDFSQGNIIQTGNALDVALASRGFFTIATDQGDRYTTDGTFMLNAEGVLVNGNGEVVMGENGPLTLNEGQITINSDGQVFSDGLLIDRLAIVDFTRLQDLVKEGKSLYAYEGADEDMFQPEEIRVKQGFLEKSNVNPTEEMVKMIEMFRSYESNQKVIQAMGEMTSSMFSGFGFS
ncbi:MAG: flagellar hook-basal body protein [Desulfotignum sp.]|nr:flagellar hook-basal body protein [Desulfotignum sp.]MCF8088886.1 flagellar hook-basal body protein [Desulfotignum sp.]MCF8136079.1 flagellar hook-basal body protein [Desulfotignum sp.]